jgi:REP element-mobilizing transposase RayT
VERDHIHLPMVIPPKYAVAQVGEPLKSLTSRQLKGNARTGCAECRGMGAGAGREDFRLDGGSNEAMIRQSMRRQGEQETGHAQLALLRSPRP